MKPTPVFLLVGFCAALTLTISSSVFTVNESQQVIITQFGKPVDPIIDSPGLHFKLPFIQDVNRLDKRFLEWDGAPVAIPTKDKSYIQVSTFARWRIRDAKTYFVRLHDERSARSRIDDVLGSETRTAIARHELIEIIRTNKSRKPAHDESLKGDGAGNVGVLHPIQYGRQQIESDIHASAAKTLMDYGIELLDVRLKRVNYNPEVLDRIYQRMITERGQIANRFRSEGEGEAARIAGQKERDLNEIQSSAYRKIQELRGEADAKASEIYANAFGQGTQAAEFYEFLKTMETYQRIFQKDASLVLSTESHLMRFLHNQSGKPLKPSSPNTDEKTKP